MAPCAAPQFPPSSWVGRQSLQGGALPPSGHLLAKAATPFLPPPAAGQPPIVNRSIQGSSESQGRSISADGRCVVARTATFAGFKDAAEFRLLGTRNLSAEINAKREPDGTSCEKRDEVPSSETLILLKRTFLRVRKHMNMRFFEPEST